MPAGPEPKLRPLEQVEPAGRAQRCPHWTHRARCVHFAASRVSGRPPPPAVGPVPCHYAQGPLALIVLPAMFLAVVVRARPVRRLDAGDARVRGQGRWVGGVMVRASWSPAAVA